MILSVVLYGCETWPVTLREDHRFRVFENRGLRRIFGPKRDEVAGGWRLHNEELHTSFTSPNIFEVVKWRKMRWKRYVACMVVVTNMCKILVGKSEEKKALERHRRKWEYNIKTVLKYGVDWIYLLEDTVQWWTFVNMVRNLGIS